MLIPKPRAAPRPRFRIENQARLCRIALNVFARLQLMLAVAHVSVPVIRLPKLAAPLQQPVRLLCRVFLPALQNLRHRCGVHLEQRVNMIRHHHPCAQVIALAVKEPHRVFDKAGYLRFAKMTLAASSVEIRFQFRPPLLVVLNLQEMFPLAAKRYGKRIGQSERDKLRQPRFIAMRQITALIPAAKPLLGFLRFGRRRPTTFALDQIAHAGIMRWPGTARFGWLTHLNIEPKIRERRKSWNAPERGCVAETSRSSFAMSGAWE